MFKNFWIILLVLFVIFSAWELPSSQDNVEPIKYVLAGPCDSGTDNVSDNDKRSHGVPEPSTMLLLASGLGAVAIWKKFSGRNKNK